MSHDHSAQPRPSFAQLASTASTPEELGVLFFKAITRSAAANKITSADGKSLVVPFAISLNPAAREGVTKLTDTIDCTQSCWMVLGQPVLCISHCTTNTHPDVAHTGSTTIDQELMSLITPGPALQNPKIVEQSLAASLVQVGTPMEAGYILINTMLTSLAQRTDLVAADGSAQLTGIATISFDDAGAAGGAGGGFSNQCSETCLEILGHSVVCFRQCHSVVQ